MTVLYLYEYTQEEEKRTPSTHIFVIPQLNNLPCRFKPISKIERTPLYMQIGKEKLASFTPLRLGHVLWNTELHIQNLNVTSKPFLYDFKPTPLLTF